MHFFHLGRDLRPAQNETNLRADAVTNRRLPILFIISAIYSLLNH